MVLLLEHGIAFLLSILAISAIMVIANKIIKTGTKREFLEIIRDKDNYPSLSLFQFYLWTIVISFGFLSIYLIRIFEGVYEPPIEELPANILVLMGISTAVPLARHKMLSTKPLENHKGKKISLSSILQDKKGKPILSKFQMFIWTLIAIIIYLAILFSTVLDISEPGFADFEQEKCKNNKYFCLTFPDIDTSLIVLMGLSQTAYLGHEYFGIKREDVKPKEKQNAGN